MASMRNEFIPISIAAILLSTLISGFIVYFDRRAFTSIRLSFYYLLAFFLAGVLLLTAILSG